MNKNQYNELLKGFIEAGYNFTFFNQPISKKNQIILRHDVDYSCKSAYEIAKVELENSIFSTYFFMISNSMYNAFSLKNREYIEKIKDMGHKISLHYDMASGELEREIDIFEKFFKTKVEILSIHRPNMESLDKITCVEHTYMKKYFKDIKYTSDSTGKFRYGHPFKTEEFRKNKSFQLLTHPEWWVTNIKSPVRILDNIIKDEHYKINKFFIENSSIYRERALREKNK